MLETAAREGVDLRGYLHDILVRISGGIKLANLDELLPENWVQSATDAYQRAPRNATRTSLSAYGAALKEESFDAVHCSLVMMFVDRDEDKISMLRELGRVLQPDGALVLTDLVIDAEPSREREIVALWRAIISQRGAADDVVDTGERQVHSHMHRRTVSQVLGLLESAGFTQMVQAYQALHTLMFMAR